VGGSFSDLVKTTTLVTDLKQLGTLREVRARYLDPAHPPANTLIPVTALARPELLLEIEAVAVLPASKRQ
jgi:enamine deaminase RidA (YjgF/YER057c/UK114 family)